MTKELEYLLDEIAIGYVWTPEQREAHRKSFAYGNVRLSNGVTTREDIDRASEELKKEGLS